MYRLQDDKGTSEVGEGAWITPFLTSYKRGLCPKIFSEDGKLIAWVTKCM